MIMMKCSSVYSQSDGTAKYTYIYGGYLGRHSRAERLLFRGAKLRNKCLKAFSYNMEMPTLAHLQTPTHYTHRPLCDFFLFEFYEFASIKRNENAHKLYKVPGPESSTAKLSGFSEVLKILSIIFYTLCAGS